MPDTTDFNPVIINRSFVNHHTMPKAYKEAKFPRICVSPARHKKLSLEAAKISKETKKKVTLMDLCEELFKKAGK